MKVINKYKKVVVLRNVERRPPTFCAIEIRDLFACWKSNGVDSSECKGLALLVSKCANRSVSAHYTWEDCSMFANLVSPNLQLFQPSQHTKVTTNAMLKSQYEGLKRL